MSAMLKVLGERNLLGIVATLDLLEMAAAFELRNRTGGISSSASTAFQPGTVSVASTIQRGNARGQHYAAGIVLVASTMRR
ncbi:MAG: hypothetical protein HPY52_12600 [Firmicutes bacterium]|nr:hypothetical protein [Bacillota bacterium]